MNLFCWFVCLRGGLWVAVAGGSDSKESACNTGDLGSIPGLGRSPGEGLPTPVFSPGESHGQRSLVRSMDLQRAGTTE